MSKFKAALIEFILTMLVVFAMVGVGLLAYTAKGAL